MGHPERGLMTPNMMHTEHQNPYSAYPSGMPSASSNMSFQAGMDHAMAGMALPIPQIRYTRNTAQLPIIPAHAAEFPRRPEFGGKGRPIRVRANFFELLTLPGQDIHHYDVKITPDVPPSLNRKIFRELVKKYSKDKLNDVAVVFDGRRNIYSPTALPVDEEGVLDIDVRLILHLNQLIITDYDCRRSGWTHDAPRHHSAAKAN
jgi:hypothetical protein